MHALHRGARIARGGSGTASPRTPIMGVRPGKQSCACVCTSGRERLVRPADIVVSPLEMPRYSACIARGMAGRGGLAGGPCGGEREACQAAAPHQRVPRCSHQSPPRGISSSAATKPTDTPSWLGSCEGGLTSRLSLTGDMAIVARTRSRWRLIGGAPAGTVARARSRRATSGSGAGRSPGLRGRTRMRLPRSRAPRSDRNAPLSREQIPPHLGLPLSYPLDPSSLQDPRDDVAPRGRFAPVRIFHPRYAPCAGESRSRGESLRAPLG